MDFTNLEPDYYQINNTKKVLYWDGVNWMRPIKDRYKRFTYITKLEEQPKNIKTITIVKEQDFAWQYKPFI